MILCYTLHFYRLEIKKYTELEADQTETGAELEALLAPFQP